MVKILAVNAGSSTLKWKLFEMPAEKELAEGLVDRLGQPKANIKVKYGDHQVYKDDHPVANFGEAVTSVMDNLKNLGLVKELHEIAGVGHRVVAGGEEFTQSTVVTPEVLLQIENLRDYAPLHNPVEAQYIDVFTKAMPWATEVAVFDTAFHQTMSPENYLYSIPYKYYKEYGARKYGAHGTSVRYVSKRAAEFLGRDPKHLKTVVLHLGSGSSITAVQDGKSVDTSMGFTPLAGITMSTRSGDIDFSLVAYLMKKLDVDTDEMLHILNHDSGVLGISELSQDQRDLKEVEFENPQAKLALDIYANRAAKYVAGYASVMDGIDVLAFTGGVGENSDEMRGMIIDRLGFLGAKLDRDVNVASHGVEKDLSAADAKIKTLLIPTNEELMIVRDVFERLPQ